MICPNCHEEVTGKFCNNCGAPLPTQPQSQNNFANTASKTSTFTKKTDDTKSTVSKNIRNKNKNPKDTTKKAKKKKGNLVGKVSKGVGNTISTTSSIAASGVKTSWKLLVMILQWVCVGLMVLVTLKLMEGFWAQRVTLGSISGVIRERNINQATYLMVAMGILGFGLLQIFWTATKKKMPDNGKMRHIDVGRGLTGFMMFLLLALVSHYIDPYLPKHPYPVLGIKQVFEIVNGFGKSFMIYNIVGIVFCIIRKS